MVLVINIYTGPLTVLSNSKWYPFNLLKKFIGWCDLKLNRDNRSPLDRLIRGGITSITVLLLSGLLGYIITLLSQNIPLAWIFEVVLLLTLIDQSSIYKKILNIYKSLKKNSLASARQGIADLTTETPDKMDSFSIARTAIEILATSLITRLLAPVFWYVLFGAIGIIIYHSITVVNIKIGRNTARYKDFGFIIKHLNAALLFLPSLLTGQLIVIASLFVPRAAPIKSYKNMIKYTDKYHEFNLGLAISTFAGALDITLGGPKASSKKTKKEPWIGDGTAKATFSDIRRGLFLFSTVCLINGLLIATIILIK